MDFQGTVPPGISPNNQSPISKASDETNQMPPLEEVYADRNINNRLKDMEELVGKLLSKLDADKGKSKKKRRSGNTTRGIYGDDHASDSRSSKSSSSDTSRSDTSDAGTAPSLTSDSDASDAPSVIKRRSKHKPKKERKPAKERESIMYGALEKDRTHLRDAHTRATSGTAIVLPVKFGQTLIENASFMVYRQLLQRIDEHEANPHNLPIFPFRCYEEKVQQKICNRLATYCANNSNRKRDRTMPKKPPTAKELKLMLTEEFCMWFERHLIPDDQQHYEQMFRQLISSYKNQRVSNSIMSYNAWWIDVEGLFTIVQDFVSVLGETDSRGKLLEYYPTLHSNRRSELEGLIPLLTIGWPSGVLLEIRKKMGLIREPKIKLLSIWMTAALSEITKYRDSNDRYHKLMGAFSSAEKAQKKTQLSNLIQIGKIELAEGISSDEEGDLYTQQLEFYEPTINSHGYLPQNPADLELDSFSAFTRPQGLPTSIPTKKKEYSQSNAPRLMVKDGPKQDLSKLPCWGEVQGKGNCKRDNCPFSHDRTLLNALAKQIGGAMEARNKVSFNNMLAQSQISGDPVEQE